MCNMDSNNWRTSSSVISKDCSLAACNSEEASTNLPSSLICPERFHCSKTSVQQSKNFIWIDPSVLFDLPEKLPPLYLKDLDLQNLETFQGHSDADLRAWGLKQP